MVQFRSLLEGLGALLPGGLGASGIGGLSLAGVQYGAPPPPPDEDEEEYKDWVDRLLDQLRQPEFFWDLITSPPATRWMRQVRDLPPITVVLPMLRGFGMDDVAGPLIRTIDTSFWVRSAGRLLGDAAAPPLFVVGWGLSVAPEQIQNIRTGAEWNEFAADFAVDSGIFLASEGVGWFTGVAGTAFGAQFGAPWVGVPAKLIGDFGTGFGLEWAADTLNLRPWLTEVIGDAPQGLAVWFSTGLGAGYEVEIPPIPTPPGLFSQASTPAPPVLVNPPITLTPTPPPILPNLSPLPVATPPAPDPDG
jgi:hypothetical protein